MPRFRVQALERFLVCTVYVVEAATRQEAETLCKAGQVAYDKLSVKEGDDEWIETLSVEEAN